MMEFCADCIDEHVCGTHACIECTVRSHHHHPNDYCPGCTSFRCHYCAAHHNCQENGLRAMYDFVRQGTIKPLTDETQSLTTVESGGDVDRDVCCCKCFEWDSDMFINDVGLCETCAEWAIAAT